MLNANSLLHLRHTSPGGVRKSRSAQTEHVVYRYDADGDEITFHSLPHGRTGAASTLDDARKAFRSSMIELLGVSRRELPPVVEHLDAVVAGMWVRTKVGAVHRDPVSDRMFLQTLLAEGPAQDALRHYLRRATNRGARPVVVIVERGDPLGTVLDQMRADDVLVVAHADARRAVGWVAIYGPRAIGGDDALHLTDPARVRAIPIEEFTQAYATADVPALRSHEVTNDGV